MRRRLLVVRNPGRRLFSPHRRRSVHYEKRKLFRLADQIRDGILTREKQQLVDLKYHIESIANTASQIQSIRKRVAIISSGDRMVCVSRALMDEVLSLSRDLDRQLHVFGTIDTRPPKKPSLRDIVAEIDALEDEFGGWRYDPDQQVVSVTTEPVTLEGMYLGPFEVKLHVNKLPKLYYTIEALDPQPAASNQEVTHPHVNSGEMCEGDARAAIAGAIREGRITDFFVLVRSVLQTYNSGSPFVALDSWHGTPCKDCGHVVSEECDFYCESCDCTYCDECYGYCQECSSSLCCGCLNKCQGCEYWYCGSCIELCANCGDHFCGGCTQTCVACEERHCENCTSECEQCEEVHCESCMDDTTCKQCEESSPQTDLDQPDRGEIQHESNQEQKSAEAQEATCGASR